LRIAFLLETSALPVAQKESANGARILYEKSNFKRAKGTIAGTAEYALSVRFSRPLVKIILTTVAASVLFQTTPM